MEKDQNILFEWGRPKEVEKYELKRLRIKGFIFFAIILLFALALIIVTLYPLGPAGGNDTASHSIGIWFLRVLVFIFAAIIPIHMFHLVPEKIRLYGRTIKLIRPVRYLIDHETLRILYQFDDIGYASPTMPWEKIKSYSLSKHGVFSQYSILTVDVGDYRRHLTLPDSDLADHIIELFSSKVPFLDHSPPFRLSTLQHVFLGLIVIAYPLLLAFINNLPSNFYIFLTSVLLLGPGTIGLLLIQRKSFFRKTNALYLCYAFVLNLCVLPLSVLYSFLYTFI